MLIHARHWQSREPLAVTVDSGRIVDAGEKSTLKPDVVADWIAPSLFDIQVNGGMGVSFNSPKLTIDEVHTVADAVRAHGTGGFCPTLVTTDGADFEHGFRTLARACQEDAELSRLMPGFHLEGPY